MFIVTIISIVILGCSADNADSNTNNTEDKETITLGATPWSSTQFPTEVAKIMLEDIGYNVEIKEAELGALFASLAEDDLDIYMDYWEPQFEEYFDRYSDTIEKVSTSYDDAERGFAVPTYMEDIEDIGDLKGREDEFDNEVLGIEESDPAMAEVPKLIETYDLDMEMLNSTESAMLTAAEDKIEKEEPVVIIGWKPHSMFEMLDIKLLTNEEAPDIYNPSTVYTIANQNLEKDNSEAYNFLKNWSMDIEDVEEMITRIEEEDADPENLAEEWIEENPDKVEKFQDID